MGETAKEQRRFMVFTGDGKRTILLEESTAQKAATQALQDPFFEKDEELFVVETKRALRFVRQSVAKRSDG